MPVKRTIIAAGEGFRYEFQADGAVTPGDLVARTTNGCHRNATADAKVEALFAIEDEIFGRGINPGSGYQAINAGVDYAIGDRVLCEACGSGMMVNANLAAGAAAIAVGDPITSAGDGTVKKGANIGIAVAVADEAVDNSAGVTATRIRIRIL